MFDMTSISQQKRALVDKSLRVDLAMFPGRPSLCVAILTKFFQQITDQTNFLFHLAGMALIIFVIRAG